MKVVGIIIESNPFHYGHKYLIDQVKLQLNPDILIALSSGYFTMRGETSLLAKTKKTKILLDNGFDIVIDFPTYQLLNSSDFFGKNALQILSKANITHLAFGSESNSLDELKEINNLMKTTKFNSTILSKLKTKISYKKAFEESLKELTNYDQETINSIMKSNNTLALGYLQALNSYPNISPFMVKRIGNDEENNSLTDYPSGTAIRENYFKNINISSYLPYDISNLSAFNEYLIKYKTIIESQFLRSSYNFKKYLHVDDGIENYIIKNYNKNLSINENINNLANKIYSKSRIRRTLLSIILELPKELTYDNDIIRILGFNMKGQNYLKNIQGKLVLNIAKSDDAMLMYDLKASKLYDILTNQNTYVEEFKFPLKGE